MSKVVPLIESIFENKGNSPELWNKSIELLLQRRDEAYFLLKYMKKKINELNKEYENLKGKIVSNDKNQSENLKVTELLNNEIEKLKKEYNELNKEKDEIKIK